jgi:hypothetical protein
MPALCSRRGRRVYPRRRPRSRRNDLWSRETKRNSTAPGGSSFAALCTSRNRASSAIPRSREQPRFLAYDPAKGLSDALVTAALARWLQRLQCRSIPASPGATNRAGRHDKLRRPAPRQAQWLRVEAIRVSNPRLPARIYGDRRTGRERQLGAVREPPENVSHVPIRDLPGAGNA